MVYPRLCLCLSYRGCCLPEKRGRSSIDIITTGGNALCYCSCYKNFLRIVNLPKKLTPNSQVKLKKSLKSKIKQEEKWKPLWS